MLSGKKLEANRARRIKREKRLRELGFEEASDEQRKSNLNQIINLVTGVHINPFR
jgi:hypothetical protein